MKEAKRLEEVFSAGSEDLADGDWTAEGLGIAKSSVYVSPKGGGAGPHTLTQAYRLAAKATSEARVALAGARLAGVLNHDLQ